MDILLFGLNLKLTKKFPPIFHNSRGCDIKGVISQLIMQEINQFLVKLNAIPNGLEKYMAFTINNTLVFVGNTQFMNLV